MKTIAALYVAKRGPYYGLDGVEPWGLPERDAREYSGPYPVVAHPPCKRWGRYWFGGPSCKTRFELGDDGGCFKAAIEAVRTWGGVLEHPEASHAWKAFGIVAPPKSGGWVRAALWDGGTTCCVEQGHYGHRARKATWLYVVGVPPVRLPELRWGSSQVEAGPRIDLGFHSAEERALWKLGRAMYNRPKRGMSQEERDARRWYMEWCERSGGKVSCSHERMHKRERLLTPEPFRDLLLDLARRVSWPEEAT